MQTRNLTGCSNESSASESFSPAIWSKKFKAILEKQKCIERLGRGGGGDQVVSVLAFSPTIRVRMPLTPTVFSIKFVLEKNENKHKTGRGMPIFKALKGHCKLVTARANPLKTIAILEKQISIER